MPAMIQKDAGHPFRDSRPRTGESAVFPSNADGVPLPQIIPPGNWRGCRGFSRGFLARFFGFLASERKKTAAHEMQIAGFFFLPRWETLVQRGLAQGCQGCQGCSVEDRWERSEDLITCVALFSFLQLFSTIPFFAPIFASFPDWPLSRFLGTMPGILPAMPASVGLSTFDSTFTDSVPMAATANLIPQRLPLSIANSLTITSSSIMFLPSFEFHGQVALFRDRVAHFTVWRLSRPPFSHYIFSV